MRRNILIPLVLITIVFTLAFNLLRSISPAVATDVNPVVDVAQAEESCYLSQLKDMSDKDVDQRIQTLEKEVIQSNEVAPIALMELGDLYDRKGLSTKATESWQKAFDVEFSQENLEQLEIMMAAKSRLLEALPDEKEAQQSLETLYEFWQIMTLDADVQAPVAFGGCSCSTSYFFGSFCLILCP